MLATLVDLAVADGRIGSLDDPLTRYVPELRQRDARFDQVTLRHLLNMNAGLHYTEYPFPTSDGAKTYYWPDLRRLALDRATIDRPPGQAWLYNNYHPLLIGLVLERSTGMPVTAWLEQRLWQPAGMAAAASWSLDSEATGFEKLESGINARTLDFARFGQLFLDQGVALDGRRVLSAEAVRDATSPENAVPLPQYRAGAYYKHFWWGQQRDDGGYDFSARGNHGQFVFVSPKNGVVIARNGRDYGVPPPVWMRMFAGLADRLGGDDRPVESAASPRPCAASSTSRRHDATPCTFRHAPHRRHAPRPLPRRAQELGAAAARLRLLLLRRRLARADHAL